MQNKEGETTIITVDDREYQEHPEIQTLLQGCQVQRLESGDYACLDFDTNPVGIERCEINNLIQKLNDGQLESQLRVAEEQYTKFYLLVEGVWDEQELAVQPYKKRKMRKLNMYLETKKHGFFQYDRLISFLIRIEDMGVRVIYTANFECSMRTVRMIATKNSEPPESHKLFTNIQAVKIPVKLSKNPAVPRLMALCPRLPEKVAIQLIEDYGSIIGILMAQDIQVDGFGKILQERLRENVGLTV